MQQCGNLPVRASRWEHGGTGRRRAAAAPGGWGGDLPPPPASRIPAYRLLERRFRELCLVWDERFASSSGNWRAVIPKVVDQFLACGLLEHGFARIRCDACAREYFLAFSCKCRYFCSVPSSGRRKSLFVPSEG